MQQRPAFGEADLTNCEREPIHLAGSVQPHGVLLVVAAADLTVRQVSANSAALLGIEAERLLGQPLARLGGDVLAAVQAAARLADGEAPRPLRCAAELRGARCELEGGVHRSADGDWIVELEPVAGVGPEAAELLAQVGAAVQRFTAAGNVGTLCDAVVDVVRELTGYDRVMVYKFDPEGHGKVIAEARDPRLESLLGHHYPASDIPQRARELYLRTRVRVLVDVNYTPAPLVPRRDPRTGQELDLSAAYLRSMSSIHLQYLKNMGVTATLVVSLVREGQLWGLIACHHYAPRNLRYPLRAAAELLGEVIATRLAAIENYAHAQVAILVRRLEQRLIEATSTEGDWRLALFRNPRTLLQPLEATGAVLFHDGEVLSAGEVPSTPELHALRDWIDDLPHEGLYECSALAKVNPALAALAPTASGVLAVRLSGGRPDYLVWLRKEQLRSLTWAGDPTKPVVLDDPLTLSPRRSFAAWSEIVRGTALAWTKAEIALGRAIGAALVDIIVQIHAVRLLIAEHQSRQIRGTMESSAEAALVTDPDGRLLMANGALRRLLGRDDVTAAGLADVAALFVEAPALLGHLRRLQQQQHPWRGELNLRCAAGAPLPVAVRAELVPGRDGRPLGFILIVADISDDRRAAEARRQLEQSLSNADTLAQPAAPGRPAREADETIGAIIANASLAAMDIADAGNAAPVAPLLAEVEASAKRAAALYGQIKALAER